jgi:uncharacterized repeat protein (TIGR02543 family)
MAGCSDPTGSSTPTYKVAFNSNGGTSVPTQTVKQGELANRPANPTRSGYIFDDWYRDSGLNVAYNFNYPVVENLTLYAGWTEGYEPRTEYTVTFDINGGSGTTPPSQTVPAGSSITLPSGSGLTKSDYTFGGWNTNTTGTGTNYSAGSFYMPTGNIILYARWFSDNEVIYTVTFDVNGGSGTTPSSQMVSAGSSVTLPSGSGLIKNGYTFGGWNTNTTGTGDNYSAGSSYTPTGNVTLYARWLSDDVTIYTVTFDINGGVGTVPDAQEVEEGSSITLPSGSGLTNTDYIFGGWNTNAAGTGDNYSAGSSYTPTGNVILYARWVLSADGSETNPFPLTINIWSHGSITSYSSSSIYYSFNVSSGTTYYVWWNDSFSGDGTKTLDVRVSAQYSSGTSIFSGVDSGYTTARSFTANQTGTVYVIVSPYNSGNTGTFAVGYSTNNTRPQNAPYIVTFDINGGEGTVPDAQEVLGGLSITLPSGIGFSRSGYDFGGWNTSPSGTGTNYSVGSSYMPIGDVTLYARWIPIYTVTFDINGGLGTIPDAQTAADGNSITLPAGSGLTKSGYIFGGWNSNAEGTGTSYSVGSSYTVIGNTTLFVQWTPAYTVTFMSRGVSVGSQIVAAGGTVTRPADPVRDAHTFEGWYSDEGLTTLYNFATPVNGHLTLYAGWDPKSLVVNFDPDVAPVLTKPVIHLSSANGPTTATLTVENPSQYDSIDWIIFGNPEVIGTYGLTMETAFPLVDGQWADGNLTSGTTTHYYQFEVVSGTTYRVWWNDSYEGSGKSLDIRASARYSNGTSIFSSIDSGYNTPQSFTANQTGTVYVIVTPYNSGYTGTYGVVFSSMGSTRPSIGANNPGAGTVIYGPVTPDVTASGGVFILNSLNTAYNTLGEHFLTVEVKKYGVPYSRTINFTVAN